MRRAPRSVSATPLLRAAGRCLLVGLLVLWVAGCGFRLRGAFNLPPAMSVTHVDARGVSGELSGQTRRVLEAGGARLATSAGEATARLRLLDERSDRRVLTVDTGGQIREYELVYALRFDVRGAAGETLVPEQSVELVRAVTFDGGEAALGRMTEQDVVRSEMLNMAVNQMMQRIVAVTRNAPRTPAPRPADPAAAEPAPDEPGLDAPAP